MASTDTLVIVKENLVVVGLDDSAAAHAALKWAADYARLTDCRLVAVHVRATDVPRFVHTTHPTEDDVADVEILRRVRQTFDSIAPEDDWCLIRLTGRPGEELVKHSQRAALLVIGTREHVGLGRLFERSVSRYCLRHSKVPVLNYPNSVHHRGQHPRVPRVPTSAVPRTTHNL